jgi:hypothetical protein
MIWSQPGVVARKSVLSESARKVHNFVEIQLESQEQISRDCVIFLIHIL